MEQALAAEHRAVETQRRRLRAVLDILPVGVVIVGRNGHIEEANAAATALWRGAPPYVLGAQAAGERHIAARWAASGAPVGWREWATVRALDRGETSAGEEIDVAIGDDGLTLLVAGNFEEAWQAWLEKAGALSLPRVMISCDQTNAASARQWIAAPRPRGLTF